MFSGLVAGMGRLSKSEELAVGRRFVLSHPFGPLALGESVAVQGVCLTVAAEEPGAFVADLSSETLARTTLGSLEPGAAVNLERALLASDRLGGHLVSGHVDGTGTITRLEQEGEMMRVDLRVPADLSRYMAEKGSVTVDGVSLTVNAVQGNGISLLLVPHTRQVTTLGQLQQGSVVNLEVDLVARYVERLLGAR